MLVYPRAASALSLQVRTCSPMAEAEDLKSLQCGFESHRVYVNDFHAVNVETDKVDFTHEGETMLKPYVDENGCLHWFGYASDQVLAKFGWNLDRTMAGHFKEWCRKHGYEVGEGLLYKRHDSKFSRTEYEYIAPLMENA